MLEILASHRGLLQKNSLFFEPKIFSELYWHNSPLFHLNRDGALTGLGTCFDFKFRFAPSRLKTNSSLSCCLVKMKKEKRKSQRQTKTAWTVGKAPASHRFWNFLSSIVPHAEGVQRGERGQRPPAEWGHGRRRRRRRGEPVFAPERLSHGQNPQMGRISCRHSLLVSSQETAAAPEQTADTCPDRTLPQTPGPVNQQKQPHLGAHRRSGEGGVTAHDQS